MENRFRYTAAASCRNSSVLLILDERQALRASSVSELQVLAAVKLVVHAQLHFSVVRASAASSTPSWYCSCWRSPR